MGELEAFNIQAKSQAVEPPSLGGLNAFRAQFNCQPSETKTPVEERPNTPVTDLHLPLVAIGAIGGSIASEAAALKFSDSNPGRINVDEFRLLRYDHKYSQDKEGEEDPRPARIKQAKDKVEKENDIIAGALGPLAAAGRAQFGLEDHCLKLAGILLQKRAKGDAKVSEADVIANYMKENGPMMYELAKKGWKNPFAGMSDTINKVFADNKLGISVDDERSKSICPVVSDRQLKEHEIPAGSLNFVKDEKGTRNTLVVNYFGVHLKD
jgi:hypothetical protein